jgi:hypothetical protein
MLRNSLALTILFSLSLSAPSGQSAPAAPAQKHESRAESEKVDLHIVGDVSGAQIYEQDIGHDLLFRLVPPIGGNQAGWVIQVVPKNESEDDPIEFSATATPPYHTYNERYIATVYGRSAADVVNLKDRHFFFVESVDDEHRAEEVVNLALYPTNVSDEDKVRILEEQKEIQLGKGELRILKARTGRGKNSGDPGTIDSIHFELNIQFSSGVTMDNIIARVARPQ